MLCALATSTPALLACERDEPSRLATWTVPGLPALPSRDPTTERTACASRLWVYQGGGRVERLCPEDAKRLGLGVVDLSDEWLPGLFSESNDHRGTLAALAQGSFEALPAGHRARRDRYLELYGIAPSLSRVRERLADDARHRCHDRVDSGPLLELQQPLDAWRDVSEQRADRWTADHLRERLDFGLGERGVTRYADLAGDPRYGSTYQGWRRVASRVAAIGAAQAHLRCDGLLREAQDRVLDTATLRAVSLYHRMHAIISWTVDRETARTMVTGSRTLDFRAALRVLRERVVDATGLIEDGSASSQETVMGHRLDTGGFARLGEIEPLSGAPDLIARATQSAAEALGWTSPDATLAFLRELAAWPAAERRVALRLPPAPRYHGEHMQLRAVIDRGDVRYDYPYTARGLERFPPPKRRPTLVLYARDSDRDIPLVRWGTTIGGYKPERLADGKLRMVYKESPVGPRLWRDLVVTPRWIPPRSTPARELFIPTGGGFRLKRELMGPSYASAYGLVMLVNHRDDGRHLTDQGIRVHGSVSYDSIDHGTSHGCHRLHNHRAVRLGQFLLRHRRHVDHGAEPLEIGRTFHWQGQRQDMAFTTRGYRYELTPPVPVDVTRGRIIGRSRPQGPTRLPIDLAKRLGAADGA